MLCEQKFGRIPERRQAQLESAPLDQLTTWTARLLAATSLDAVFDDADQG